VAQFFLTHSVYYESIPNMYKSLS